MNYNDIDEAFCIKKEIEDIEKAIPFIANSRSPAIPFPSNLICGILSERRAVLLNRLTELGVLMGQPQENAPINQEAQQDEAEAYVNPKDFPAVVGKYLDKEV